MGRRGPKPEPAAIKEKKGSSRRPIGSDPAADATSSTPSRVEAPSWLKKEGMDVWTRLAPRLTAMNLLSQTDAETFARYCRNFARWLKMQKVLDDEGETYESESVSGGKLKRAHPAYLIADRLERQLIAAEACFGLNPAERQRIFAARAAGGGTTPDLFTPNKAPEAATTAPAPTKPTSARKSAVGYLQ